MINSHICWDMVFFSTAIGIMHSYLSSGQDGCDTSFRVERYSCTVITYQWSCMDSNTHHLQIPYRRRTPMYLINCLQTTSTVCIHASIMINLYIFWRREDYTMVTFLIRIIFFMFSRQDMMRSIHLLSLRHLSSKRGTSSKSDTCGYTWGYSRSRRTGFNGRIRSGYTWRSP